MVGPHLRRGAAARRRRDRAPPRASARWPITGQWASTVPVDASGTPTGPCITWQDTSGGRLRARAHRRARLGVPRTRRPALGAPHRRRAVAQRRGPDRPHPRLPRRASRPRPRRRGGTSSPSTTSRCGSAARRPRATPPCRAPGSPTSGTSSASPTTSSCSTPSASRATARPAAPHRLDRGHRDAGRRRLARDPELTPSCVTGLPDLQAAALGAGATVAVRDAPRALDDVVDQLPGARRRRPTSRTRSPRCRG